VGRCMYGKIAQLLLEIYRIACHNIEMHQSLPQIRTVLQKYLPISQILIRCPNLEHRQFETLATDFGEYSLKEAIFTPVVCDQPTIDSFLFWHQKGEFFAGPIDQQEDNASWLLPEELLSDNEVIALPLTSHFNLFSYLVLIAKENTSFKEENLTIVKQLQEPFSAVVENDLHFRELIRLREAAEADKNALLAKLSRKKIEDTIIGAENGLAQVMERVRLVAKTDLPVLILGESGTGKELIARAIHRQSPRANGPFIRVNCGAIPSELIDAQLFGHERGAFTGAFETRKGWFERADGGTLLLDEVGELPLPAQVRLLRVLQDGWMERVGGKKPIKVDVRVVLATNRYLAKMVEQGQFREDLWYRISTFPIYLPPLRERLQDMKALAEHFAQRSAIRFGLPLVLPTQQDIEILCSYSWPGNIRELASVIDRAALLGDGKKLEIRKALGWSANFEKRPIHNQNIAGNNVLHSLNEVIKQHIIRALERTKGKVEGPNGAAAVLNINPNTLRSKMRKLGIDWRAFRRNM